MIVRTIKMLNDLNNVEKEDIIFAVLLKCVLQFILQGQFVLTFFNFLVVPSIDKHTCCCNIYILLNTL